MKKVILFVGLILLLTSLSGCITDDCPCSEYTDDGTWGHRRNHDFEVVIQPNSYYEETFIPVPKESYSVIFEENNCRRVVFRCGGCDNVEYTIKDSTGEIVWRGDSVDAYRYELIGFYYWDLETPWIIGIQNNCPQTRSFAGRLGYDIQYL